MPHCAVLADQTYQRCPDCGRTVPVDRRFVTWCEGCEWNVDPSAEDLAPVPGWRVRMETKFADTLYRELVRAKPVPTAAVVLGISEAAATDAELMRAARPALTELANPAPA